MPECRGDCLSFFNQLMEEVAEIAEFSFGSEVGRVRQLGQTRKPRSRMH